MIDIREHGGIFGGGVSLKGKKLINFYIQETEPTPKSIGDVWVKTSKILDDVFVNDLPPINPLNGQVWQSIDRLDYAFKMEEVESFIGDGKSEIYLALHTGEFLENIPTDKRLLWENKFLKLYGNLVSISQYNATMSFWQSLDGYVYDGSNWNQYSVRLPKIFEDGVEYTPFILLDARGSINRVNGYLELYNSNGTVTAITDTTVNLSSASALKFDVEAYGGDSKELILQVTNTKNSDRNDYVAHFRTTNWNRREIYTLDVSNLVGDFYIRLFKGTGHISFRFHKIWADALKE